MTHKTAETELVGAAGAEFAYRRFGRPGNLPLVMLQHFRGNLDNWDPALTDALAAEREIILVDYPGVGSSTGEPSDTIAQTARQIIAFADALGLGEIDLLGFSIGGFVAQEMALVRPTLLRRLVLAATGPKGAPGMHGWRQDIADAARGESKPENLLYIMFAHTETSQAKGMEFLGRFMERQEGRDTPTSDAARDAQYDAIVEWGIPDHAALQRLTGIKSPTLIIQGDDDLMIPTKLSHLMAGLIPDARDSDLFRRRPRLPVPVSRGGRRRSQRIPSAMTQDLRLDFPDVDRPPGGGRSVRGDFGAADEPPRTRAGPRSRLADSAGGGRRCRPGARLQERRSRLLHLPRRPDQDHRVPGRGREADRRGIDSAAVPLPKRQPARQHRADRGSGPRGGQRVRARRATCASQRASQRSSVNSSRHSARSRVAAPPST